MSINELKQGVFIVFEGMPYQVLSAAHSHIGRGGSSVQVKMKNLKNGSVVGRSFKPSDSIDEAEIEREKIEYIYSHRGEFWFSKLGDRSKRFSLPEEVIEEQKPYLKSNIELEAIKFGGEIMSVSLPIKMELKVVESPPNIRGNTSQGGTKIATLETGTKVSVPLFIEVGDIVRINTQSGEYVERIR